MEAILLVQFRLGWFSFDSVRPLLAEEDRGWAEIVRYEATRNISTDSAIGELEALMITAFGLHGTQNKMPLLEARQPWEQLTAEHCWPGGVGRKVHARRI